MFIRVALWEGKLVWGKNGTFEAVEEKCDPGQELKKIREIAQVSAIHEQTSPMAAIMRKLRASKKFWEEMGGMSKFYGVE